MKMLTDLMKKKTDLQIAPLIDVVFLLLIYFMVTASLIKKEADLAFMLPYLPPQQPLPEMPIEVLVEVSEQGAISVEGMVFGEQGRDLEGLVEQFTSLKAAADSSGSELIVSVMPDDKALHGRIVSVMDACAAANVRNMSFAMSM